LATEIQIICLECGARGPRARFVEEAISLWEGRYSEVNSVDVSKTSEDKNAGEEAV
jgi:hypothetical protein